MAADRKEEIIRMVTGFLFYLLLVPATLFAAAGTVKWPMAWAYSALLLLAALGSRVAVWRKNPDLLSERGSSVAAENVKPWDRTLVVIIGLYGPLFTALVAGLDHRLGWSDRFTTSAQISAALIMLPAFGLAVWAMIVNRFFSAVARIQDDRGHQVISSGPYRVMRHPGYAGSLLSMLAFPAMMNSTWALLPALGTVAALVIRTAREDAMLMEELEGYSEYATKTRDRLIPMIW